METLGSGIKFYAGKPGGFNNYDLLQLVVASEVFDLFGDSGAFLRKVALKASQKWAGADMTANGFLVTYLKKAVPSRSNFLVCILTQSKILHVTTRRLKPSCKFG